MFHDNDRDAQVHMLRKAITTLVRHEGADLSARQLAVLLISSTTPGPHTVRGLAAELNVTKPAITRALDRLGMHGLAERMADHRDRRSVLVQVTPKGRRYLAYLRTSMSNS